MVEYRTRVAELHRELGIPADYADSRGLSMIAEAAELVVVISSGGSAERRLVPAAAARWARLAAAAERDGVVLRLLSGYRSPEYQRDLIRRKLDRGERLADALRVLAAPGYSEHHSGHAVDIGTPGCEPLTEVFERTDAFTWLHRHAGEHGFSLSYPRDNPSGIIYEPWHWALAPVPTLG